MPFSLAFARFGLQGLKSVRSNLPITRPNTTRFRVAPTPTRALKPSGTNRSAPGGHAVLTPAGPTTMRALCPGTGLRGHRWISSSTKN